MYTSPNIIQVNKFRRMRWVGHIACICRMRSAYNILVGKPGGKRPLGDLGIDGNVMQDWTIGKHSKKVWTAFI
jgi:hypothetical protein